MLELAAVVVVILVAGTAIRSLLGNGGADSALLPTSGGGLRLGAQEISTYAKRAGFTGDALVTAIAVALAESSGDTTAYNPETKANAPTGKGSFGLWQIYLNAHPEFAGQDLFDPQVNANAAYLVYKAAGYSFKPWSTFKNSAYAQYLDDAQAYA